MNEKEASAQKVIGKRALAAATTRERLLDVAERLFADGGLEGVSVREIAAEAHVDLAMIAYHFGSKEGLYRAIFRRRAEPLNALRLKQLERSLGGNGKSARLEDVVYALVEPYVHLRNNSDMGGLNFARMLVWELIDPKERERGIIRDNFDDLAKRFIAALSDAEPAASKRDAIWAYHFGVSTLLHLMAGTGRIEELSKGKCRTTDVEEILERVVIFIAHGMRGTLSRSIESARSRSPRRKQHPKLAKT